MSNEYLTELKVLITRDEKNRLPYEATFVRVANSFCGEYLSATTSITRDEAVAMMVLWDSDGYAKKE